MEGWKPPEDHRFARLDQRPREQELRTELRQHLLDQIVLAHRNAA